ncbi:MAG TPA: tetraacyldisaccharide 4'-kinase, partial [Xanthomonadales bacterium]|nr:tetraacyldisaccharide 4'-kinase [Xanthomonadales bacterium]
MRTEIERWLNQVWYTGQRPPWWLRALVPVYRAAFLLDRGIKQSRPSDLADKPILVIGNLTVGGSGKTPLVIRLCKVLQDAGLKVGVASRGYGRSSSGLQVVNKDSDPQRVGDEPLLIAQRAGVAVIVANDRCAAAKALFDRGVDLVIADDGLQHHRLPRSMEICVVDGSRGFGNGLQLPAGPLREPLQRLQQVDHVVLNGESDISVKLPKSVKMALVPGMLHALDQKLSWRLSQFSGCKASAVAGIANPERFFYSLEQAGIIVDPHSWPDHHAYTQQDFAGLNPDYP